MKNFIDILNEEFDRAAHLSQNTAIRYKNGNLMKYKLRGRMLFQGLPIAIENYAGDIRAGFDPDGKPWKTIMNMAYGYIKKTIGADNEGVDVYVGPNKRSKDVYVIKQHKIEKVKTWQTDDCPDCRRHIWDCDCDQYYDEDKVMLGYDNVEDAKNAYLSQYNNMRFLGPIHQMTMNEFIRIMNMNKLT